jgi:DNA mismatch endonuclease (patch repair protein)
MPQSNADFWTKKFDRNVARDHAAQRALRRLGWAVAVVWECETKDMETAGRKLRKKLAASRRKWSRRRESGKEG